MQMRMSCLKRLATCGRIMCRPVIHGGHGPVCCTELLTFRKPNQEGVYVA